jgi:hypothetical protein
MRLRIKTPKELLNLKDPLGILTLVLTLVALTSTFLLDYMNFRQNRTSYFPWAVSGLSFQPEKNIAGEKKPEFLLAEFINQNLRESGLAEESITKEKTEDGLFYFSVKTTEPEYKRIKEKLRFGLKKQRIKTRIKEEKSKTGEIIASMEIRQQARTSGWLIFRYAPALSPEKAGRTPLAPAEKKEPAREVAVVIDDMGADLKILQELISLKAPLTVAVLPDTPYAGETSELASKNGLEVIIHLPLEAFNDQPGSAGAEGLIKTSMSYQDVWSILEKDYERVPQARGLNNHMGSKATTDEHLMEIIMSFLKEKNLFFLDSKTSNRSIAYDLAVKKKIPAASRQVFLDADEDRSKIKDRLFELFNHARKNGQAVGIGHPYGETIQVLKSYLPRAEEYGIKLVTVSSIIKK